MKTLIIDTSPSGCEQVAACLPSALKARSVMTWRMLSAILLSQTERPRIIVIDIAHENGIGLLRVLRRINVEAKILVFSSLMLFERRCLSEGADGFFLKYQDTAAFHAAAENCRLDFAAAGAAQ